MTSDSHQRVRETNTEKEHFHPEYPATSREKRDYPRMDADFLENSSKTSHLSSVPLKKARFPHLQTITVESARIRLRLYRIQALLGTTQLFQLKGGNLRTTKKKTESTFLKGSGLVTKYQSSKAKELRLFKHDGISFFRDDVFGTNT